MTISTPVGSAFWMNNPGVTPKGSRKEFIDPDAIPWTDRLMPGTRFKLLYANLVNGSFSNDAVALTQVVDYATDPSASMHDRGGDR